MNSFLLPGALAAWAALSAWMAIQFARWAQPPRGVTFRALVFAALLPLPLADEILTQPRLSALCRDMAVVTVHDRAARGREVRLSALPSETVPGLPVPVTLHKWLYVDAATGQPVLSFNRLHTAAGKLGTFAGATRPLVFEGTCEPRALQHTLAALELTPASDTAAPASSAP